MADIDTSTREGQLLRDLAAKWLNRIEDAGKKEKNWLDDAAIAVSAYTGEGSETETSATEPGVSYNFNILFANVETIVPATINSPPAPDVRRRFGSEDPAGKDFAEMLERAMRVQVDDSKLQVEMEALAQDGFLAGRGVIRLRFESEFEGGETTEKELQTRDALTDPSPRDDEMIAETLSAPAAPEMAKNERVTFEAVSWRDCRHGPAKRWCDVPWWAFRHAMQPEDFTSFADKALLDRQFLDGDKGDDAEGDDRVVWEVWDKNKREVLFISDDSKKILKRVPDPLGLSNFFPIATPVQPIEVNGRLKPVNPFSIYRKLADELDNTTKRIRIITKQLKVKAWYGMDPTDMAAILAADDTEFVPVSNVELWAQNGGMEKAIAFWPVEKLILVLKELYVLRDQTKQAIYEITGISDIVRGASKATETLGAQQIKSQWGSLRIQKMQRMLERAARDVFVMMSEIIPSKFSVETLERMTEIQLQPTQQDLTPIPPAGPDGQPIPGAKEAEQARQARLAKFAAIKQLMTERASSFYRIDVETDSTIRADLTRQKQEATEFMNAASGYFEAVGPLVQNGALPMELAVEIFSSFSRMFNLGKSVEDALDELVKRARQAAGQQAGPQQPDPAQQAQAAAQEAEQQQKADESAARVRQIDAGIARDDQLAKADLAVKKIDFTKKQIELASTTSALVQPFAGAFETNG